MIKEGLIVDNKKYVYNIDEKNIYRKYDEVDICMKGWFFFKEDNLEKLKIFIDGNDCDADVTRQQRSDVIAAFPNYNVSSDVGFEIKVHATVGEKFQLQIVAEGKYGVESFIDEILEDNDNPIDIDGNIDSVTMKNGGRGS